MTAHSLRFIVLLLCASSLAGARAKKEEPLHKKSFQEIIRKYLFVADFATKPPTRDISEHLFWRYPFKVPKVSFAIDHDIESVIEELPSTAGDGRAYQHMTAGRTALIEKRYEDAKNIFLATRARFGKDFPYHRRVDYYIGLSFLGKGAKILAENGHDFEAIHAKEAYSNAATFLSWAFLIKRKDPDSLVEKAAAKQFYNLAAIYFRYKRYAAAYGAAQSGMQALAKSGEKRYRVKLRRILAESYIQNRTYLEAVQQFDTAIRQDPDPVDAAAMFARVGDIYFDLNNYELAEENYALANRIDQEAQQVSPAQFVLRGESLFWLGKFSEAQKMFFYALETESFRNTRQLNPETRALAHLRLADAYLALKKYKEAKLEYFRVQHNHRNTSEARVAKIRSACLELPAFQGNNVEHARKMLEGMRTDEIPLDARELAWACEVGSYADRERTNAMVKRVKQFYAKYPDSRFLKSLVNPVKEVKAKKLSTYFKAGKTYQAIRYFEQNRELLYKKVPQDIKRKLFASYVDVFQPEKAREFWSAYQHAPDSDLKLIRQVVTAIELSQGKQKRTWVKRQQALAKRLNTRKWKIKPSEKMYRLINRVTSSSEAARHRGWVYSLAKQWAEKDSDLTCNMLYPLASHMYAAGDKSPIPQGVIEKDITQLIKQQLPQLLEVDETCGISLLHLEVTMLANRPSELGARYLARANWRMSKPLTSIFWEVSERLLAANKRSTATEIWRIINDKAPADAPEKEFAKVRTDKSRTEFDKLWR